MEEKCESFLEQALLETSSNQPLIVVSSETYGLASAVKIACLTCQKRGTKLESARSNNDDNDEDHGAEIKKIEAKHFAINQQFILGCHKAGMGPGDADIVCSAMNLPIAVGFWSTQGNFTAVDDVVGAAEVATAALAMEEASWEEIFQTLNVHERGDWADKGRDFEWWNTLSGTERLSVINMPQLTISYDMGWQHRFSWNKYNSISGPAFLYIGSYMRKILDYQEKSKVCNVCNRDIWYKKPIMIIYTALLNVYDRSVIVFTLRILPVKNFCHPLILLLV